MKISKMNVEDCKDRFEKITTGNVKGTWTSQEDEILIKQFSKFGRNWALIAKKIEGRTGK